LVVSKSEVVSWSRCIPFLQQKHWHLFKKNSKVNTSFVISPAPTVQEIWKIWVLKHLCPKKTTLKNLFYYVLFNVKNRIRIRDSWWYIKKSGCGVHNFRYGSLLPTRIYNINTTSIYSFHFFHWHKTYILKLKKERSKGKLVPAAGKVACLLGASSSLTSKSSQKHDTFFEDHEVLSFFGRFCRYIWIKGRKKISWEKCKKSALTLLRQKSRKK